MIHQYFNQITDLLKTVEKEEKKAMADAAQKVAEAIQNGGIIHLFGCGHSHILTEEVYYRAGGLVSIHPIFHEPLMLHEGAVRSSDLERKNDYAKVFMEEQDIRPEDIVIILSTSGRNPVPVDAAKMAKDKGAFVIGITSIAYSSSQPSRHDSGEYLYDAVDLVIDNHAPIGDALLSHEKVKIKFSPSSTVIGAAILNAVFAASIKQMAENNYEPPIFLSGNLEGSDEHNQVLIDRYRERVNL
ncbi:SIS domain-containing protein [Oceanobacillus sojae]|uniref:SIS domain-containing protein n=1 Tax=Oceanobacillus sojae TaxID=582851 RepID=UPI0021A4302C|nr:SIS domain-containing protein [Oceanobacillus sojae]MCT1902055.1 SIS domain-containing protein [Oceanobacillus sojae]